MLLYGGGPRRSPVLVFHAVGPRECTTAHFVTSRGERLLGVQMKNSRPATVNKRSALFALVGAIMLLGIGLWMARTCERPRATVA